MLLEEDRRESKQLRSSFGELRTLGWQSKQIARDEAPPRPEVVSMGFGSRTALLAAPRQPARKLPASNGKMRKERRVFGFKRLLADRLAGAGRN